MFSASAVLVCKYLFNVAKIWEFKTWKRRMRSTIRFSCCNKKIGWKITNDTGNWIAIKDLKIPKLSVAKAEWRIVMFSWSRKVRSFLIRLFGLVMAPRQVWKGCHQEGDSFAMASYQTKLKDNTPIRTLRERSSVAQKLPKDEYSTCLHLGCLDRTDLAANTKHAYKTRCRGSVTGY